MIVKIRKTCNVLADNVKFYVCCFTDFNVAEVGVGHRVRDERHLESAVRRVADSQ